MNDNMVLKRAAGSDAEPINTNGRVARSALLERGMVTIEYAIGAVLVLILVGVIIASIQQGWFSTLVQQLVTFLMGQIQVALRGGA